MRDGSVRYHFQRMLVVWRKICLKMRLRPSFVAICSTVGVWVRVKGQGSKVRVRVGQLCRHPQHGKAHFEE